MDPHESGSRKHQGISPHKPLDIDVHKPSYFHNVLSMAQDDKEQHTAMDIGPDEDMPKNSFVRMERMAHGRACYTSSERN